MTRRARAVVLRCRPGQQCDFHADGGPELEKCPGVCDADGCNRDGHYEVGSGRTECATHGAITLMARAVKEALAADEADGDAKEGR